MERTVGRRRWSWVGRGAALCLGAAVLLAGSAACRPPASGTTPSAIRLGVVTPLSGTYQRTGERVLRAVRLAVAERNARGGIGGQPVDLLIYDDRGELTPGALSARRLARDPDVLGVIGHLTPASAEGALPAYREARLPAVLLASLAEERPEPGGPVVQLAPSVTALAQAAAAFAVQRQARTAAVVTGPLPHDLAQAGALQQAVARAGLRVLRTEALLPAASHEAVVRLSAAAPDVLFIAASLPTGAAFWREAAGSARFAVLVGGVNVAPDEVAAAVGPTAPALYYPTPAPGLSERPGLTAFAARYRQQWGEEPDAIAALAYDAAGLLLEALDRAAARPGASRRGVQEALGTLRTYGGVTGRVIFDAAGRLADPTLFFLRAGTAPDHGGTPPPAPARSGR